MTPRASDRGWGADPSRALQGQVLSASILRGGGDPDIVDILAEALRADGYVAETFTHPVRACEYILASPPELVVTDLYMPYLSGAELVTRVRAVSSSLPIIIMSASANSRSLALLPAQGFLGKPFDLDDLSELVAKLLHV